MEHFESKRGTINHYIRQKPKERGIYVHPSKNNSSTSQIKLTLKTERQEIPKSETRTSASMFFHWLISQPMWFKLTSLWVPAHPCFSETTTTWLYMPLSSILPSPYSMCLMLGLGLRHVCDTPLSQRWHTEDEFPLDEHRHLLCSIDRKPM